jgi:hypothetical protein
VTEEAPVESTSPGLLCCDKVLLMDLYVELLGEEIVVTRPGTDFLNAYRKRPDSPTLKLTRSWVDPRITSPEFK